VAGFGVVLPGVSRLVISNHTRVVLEGARRRGVLGGRRPLGDDRARHGRLPDADSVLRVLADYAHFSASARRAAARPSHFLADEFATIDGVAGPPSTCSNAAAAPDRRHPLRPEQRRPRHRGRAGPAAGYRLSLIVRVLAERVRIIRTRVPASVETVARS
jgi:hypothetical protein